MSRRDRSDTSALQPWAGARATAWQYAALGSMLLGVAALLVDMPLARYFRANPWGGTARDVLQMSEFFGHAIGVTFLLWAMWLLDPRRRREIPRIVIAVVGAGLVADVVKLLVMRGRPRAVHFEILDPLATFGEPLPLFWGGHHQQSFPSAHAAVAFALALCLSSCYPRGRRLFVTLAMLCGLHRMQSCSHYLSDVAFGAALGLIVAHACYVEPHVGRFLERWRAKMRTPTADEEHRDDDARVGVTFES